MPSEINNNDIIFLGEIHRVGSLWTAANKMLNHLAKDKPVVYAMETGYSLSIPMEAESSGNPNSRNSQYLHESMVKYCQAFAQRDILITALDLDHDIFRQKRQPYGYLKEMVLRSNSPSVSKEISNEIELIFGQNTFKKMDTYLKNLKTAFQQHFDAFSEQDKEEILFGIDLFIASNRYQHASHGDLRNQWWPFSESPREIRYPYFIKTIERAYAKSIDRDAILLCRVGSYHASFFNKYSEAKYFKKKKDIKTLSINMVPLDRKTNKVKSYDKIDLIAKSLMGENNYAFLSLSQLQDNSKSSLNFSKYFKNHKTMYDGLLFVRRRK